MSASIGQRVERLFLYGFKVDESLSDKEREEIIEYTLSFEECGCPRNELEAMGNKDLITQCYWAMADYAKGQM